MIYLSRRVQQQDLERPAKAAGRSSRFRPKASAQRLHQRNGFVVAHQTLPTNESCAGGWWSADFSGASPVASWHQALFGSDVCDKSLFYEEMVGASGFEPPSSWSRTSGGQVLYSGGQGENT